MHKSLIVLDNVLPTCEGLSPLIDTKVDLDWYSLNEEHLYKDFCLSILDIARQYFDLSSAVGYEFWGNNGMKLDWHCDKDESLYKKSGQLDYPLCSTVYYLEASKFMGGELLIENNLVVVPKTNRLVIFPPGVSHTVNPHKGKRIALLVNPWSHTLCR